VLGRGIAVVAVYTERWRERTRARARSVLLVGAGRVLLRLVVMMLVGRVVLADPLATAVFLFIRGPIAETSPFLLVPCAQGLAAEHEVVVLNDGGLDPALRGQVELPGVRVHGVDVGNNVVLILRR